MPKIRKDSYQKGPLLIKIEACPRSGRTEPCSEECKKECSQKTYTIFEPKPPRRRTIKDSGDEPKPRISKNTQDDNMSTESHKSSSSRNSKTRKPSFEETIETESPRTVKIPDPPENSADSESHKSATSRSLKSLKTSQDESDSQKSASIKSYNNVDEPPISKEAPEEKYSLRSEESDCVLEICVRERHKQSCKYWKSSGKTDGEYNVISTQVIKLCRAPDSEKQTPCPVCSKFSNKEIEDKTRQVIQNLETQEIADDLSEPSTYIESVFSRESGQINLPDFRNMPTIPMVTEKKPNLLRRMFCKNKKPSPARIHEKENPQCVCTPSTSPTK